MNICVIGTGYVGLVSGVVFADLGNDVVCVDKNEAKIAGLCSGVLPIYEPGLEEMVARNAGAGRLDFTTDMAGAVRTADVVFIAVGTPPREDGSTDLSQITAAAQEIAPALEGFTVIVNKSTVPVGTGALVRRIVAEACPDGASFEVVSNPEFLREGSAIQDALAPDRVVIGASHPRSAARMRALYAPLGCHILETDVASAEMIKYASNAFLATKISFANAIANVCEEAGADVTQVVQGMGLDARIGPAFLSAGLGYGGSCFPKDTRSLIATSDALGYDFDLLRAVERTNARQTERFVARVCDALGGGDLTGRTVAVLGLAFKDNTDDVRESKALEVAARLLEAGASVRAYDPIATENARRLLPDITYCADAYDAAAGADALLIVTEWAEFRHLSLECLREAMTRPLILDGRNLYDPAEMERLGFEYHGVGRPSAFAARGERSLAALAGPTGPADWDGQAFRFFSQEPEAVGSA